MLVLAVNKELGRSILPVEQEVVLIPRVDARSDIEELFLATLCVDLHVVIKAKAEEDRRLGPIQLDKSTTVIEGACLTIDG